MANILCPGCGKHRDSRIWTECRSCGHMVCDDCIVDDDLCEDCFDNGDEFLEGDDEEEPQE